VAVRALDAKGAAVHLHARANVRRHLRHLPAGARSRDYKREKRD
jgi:hypothetical protein